jgi:hypothetical protein
MEINGKTPRNRGDVFSQCNRLNMVAKNPNDVRLLSAIVAAVAGGGSVTVENKDGTVKQSFTGLK